MLKYSITATIRPMITLGGRVPWVGIITRVNGELGRNYAGETTTLQKKNEENLIRRQTPILTKTTKLTPKYAH